MAEKASTSTEATSGGYTYYLCSGGWDQPPFALARLKDSPPDVDRWTPNGWVPADNLHENIANVGNDARGVEVTPEQAQEWIEKKKGGPAQPPQIPQTTNTQQAETAQKPTAAKSDAVDSLREKVNPKK